MSSSFSFFKDLKFLSYRSFTCLVIQRYIICDCCEGHCLPNSFFSPFIICIKAGYWFFKLVFYPATLLKMFISYQISLKNIWTHKHMLLYNLWIAILLLPLFQFISYFFFYALYPWSLQVFQYNMLDFVKVLFFFFLFKDVFIYFTYIMSTL